jgi:hypothetical protein
VPRGRPKKNKSGASVGSERRHAKCRSVQHLIYFRKNGLYRGHMSCRTMVGSFLAAILFFGGPAAASADTVSDGDAAFHNGDYSKAIKLLMPQARRGNAVAQRDIGIMYFGGNGFARDSREAVKWFELSARQGQIGAQVDLGIAYATGDGVQPSPVQAYVWFAAAASQRPGVKTVAARYRDHIATQLPPDQLQAAQRMAAQCQATNFGNCGPE